MKAKPQSQSLVSGGLCRRRLRS